jgi:hypothetical protein
MVLANLRSGINNMDQYMVSVWSDSERGVVGFYSSLEEANRVAESKKEQGKEVFVEKFSEENFDRWCKRVSTGIYNWYKEGRDNDSPAVDICCWCGFDNGETRNDFDCRFCGGN